MPFLLLIFAVQINGFNEQNPLRVISDRKAMD